MQEQLPLTWTCHHPNASKPFYAGGNYGCYGYQKCPDCGYWRDDYTEWRKSHIPASSP